jgi:hypothetical protein
VDENVQVNTTRTGIIGKTFSGNSTTTTTTTTKENSTTTTVPTRPMAGKVIGGLKGGARRAVLGDISNAGHQPKVVPKGKVKVD